MRLGQHQAGGKIQGQGKTSQGYRCKGYGRYFIERDGFGGKHYLKEIILRLGRLRL
jgi:hypothetical protein